MIEKDKVKILENLLKYSDKLSPYELGILIGKGEMLSTIYGDKKDDKNH